MIITHYVFICSFLFYIKVDKYNISIDWFIDWMNIDYTYFCFSGGCSEDRDATLQVNFISYAIIYRIDMYIVSPISWNLTEIQGIS